MICPNCKAESEGCAYCPNCGTPLTQQSYYQAPPSQRSYTSPEQNYYSNQYQYGAPAGSAQATGTQTQYNTQQAGQWAPNNTYNNNYYYAGMPVSYKNRLVMLLLCVFLGYIGIHRFYAGKIGTGILYIFTGGLFGIGVIVDIIMIATGSFKDSNGCPVLRW